ncbi:MAG: hypothetical protein NVS2B7_36990 [Herpetosiphon sp.]
MHKLLTEITQVLGPLAHVFSEPVSEWVKVLLVGAVLVPGQRTVTSVLRVLGLRATPSSRRGQR